MGDNLPPASPSGPQRQAAGDAVGAVADSSRKTRVSGIGDAPLQQRYVSVKGAASYLSVSPHTIYEWVMRKQVPHHRLGRRVVFDVQELDQWVHSN